MDNHKNIFIKNSLNIKNILKPPITLPAYSAVEGYFYFRDLDLRESKFYQAILTIDTTQGSNVYKINIKPIFPELIKEQ